MSDAPVVKVIALSDINTEDKSSQVRSASREGADACDPATVDKYVEITSLPPIDVFRLPDGSLTPGDGWHRVTAAKKRGDTTIKGHEHTGTLEDAKVFAIRANCKHGLPFDTCGRNNAIAILHDLKWSSRKIGTELGCDHKTVLNVVNEHEVEKALVGKFPQVQPWIGSTEARTIAKAPKEYWADLAKFVSENNCWTASRKKVEDLEEMVAKLSDPDLSEEEKAAVFEPKPEPAPEPEDDDEWADVGELPPPDKITTRAIDGEVVEEHHYLPPEDDEATTKLPHDPISPDRRRAAWLSMTERAEELAQSLLDDEDILAIASADPGEIDAEIADAAFKAWEAWGRVHRALMETLKEKQTSTLPRDGSNEVPVATSAELFKRLAIEIEAGKTKKRRRPNQSTKRR